MGNAWGDIRPFHQVRAAYLYDNLYEGTIVRPSLVDVITQRRPAHSLH